MKTQKLTKTHTAITLLSILALQACGPANQGSVQPSQKAAVDSSVDSGEEVFADADSEATMQIQSVRGDRSWRKRFVRINVSYLKRVLQKNALPTTLKLNLFDNKKLELVLEQVQKVSEDNYVVVGRIAGDDESAVTLVLNDGVLLANVKSGQTNDSYEVRYAANGLHEVRIPDDTQDDEQECEPLEESNDERAADQPMFAEDALRAQSEDLASPMATPVLDMLVAYTPRARSYQGGTAAIKALIQMGIADTNRALADSGVKLQVRLAGTIETKQNESSSMSADLTALRSKTDSRFNEVHTERARLGADQVTLVASYNGVSTAAGIGYVNATSASAFTVVKAYYFRQYTFSHELGHNIGLNHSDGYQNTSGRFRTIIAYGNYPRIRRYSNPSITYNGYRTGTTSHNEAKILNAKAASKAALLQSKL